MTAELELVPCALICGCGHTQSIPLPADAPIREALRATSCVSCGRLGALRLAPILKPPPPLPVRVFGVHEAPPDDLGDEDLLARRPWRT